MVAYLCLPIHLVLLIGVTSQGVPPQYVVASGGGARPPVAQQYVGGLQPSPHTLPQPPPRPPPYPAPAPNPPHSRPQPQPQPYSSSSQSQQYVGRPQTQQYVAPPSPPSAPSSQYPSPASPQYPAPQRPPQPPPNYRIQVPQQSYSSNSATGFSYRTQPTGYVPPPRPQPPPPTFPSYPQPQPNYGGGQQPQVYGSRPYPTGSTGGGGVDTSDQCFRKYSNCIIVNAQPYERRSTVDVQQCKNLCLQSTTGVYKCRAFVYDRQNRVCDLFAHTGNQYPAKLMQFYGRDYYEPTGACDGVSLSTTTTATPDGSSTTTSAPTESSCGAGLVERYLRIQGFQLQGNDGVRLNGISIDQCVQACSDNQGPGGEAAPCLSFDYVNGDCIITTDAAVPTGGGQLVQNPNSDYYEKLCVDEQSVAGCPTIFDRFPQMILVGFAETVVDASTFEECLDNCLNSQDLFGFSCISGMFYFEEQTLNCILNTEDRTTQPDLFTEENNDIVDYFDTGCNARSSLNRFRARQRSRTFTGRGRGAVVATVDSAIVEGSPRPLGPPTERLVQADFDQWTQWSPCDRSKDGRRVRYRRCRAANLKQCPAETEWCNRQSSPRKAAGGGGGEAATRAGNELNVDAARLSVNGTSSAVGHSLNCADDVCCAVFGGCRIGMEKSSVTGSVDWCTNPCQQL